MACAAAKELLAVVYARFATGTLLTSFTVADITLLRLTRVYGCPPRRPKVVGSFSCAAFHGSEIEKNCAAKGSGLKVKK